MDEHGIRGNTGAAYRRHEASELICSCHTLRHEALDGWSIGFGREVVVALRYSTKSLDGVRLGEFVGWKGKPTSDRVRVCWQCSGGSAGLGGGGRSTGPGGGGSMAVEALAMEQRLGYQYGIDVLFHNP